MAGTTAVVACGLLALAVAPGWLGADVDRGVQYCERSCGLVRQPANTWSNVGFVLAGLAVAWHARHPDALGRTMSARPVLATLYAVVVVLLGPASAAMHATESALGGVLDLTSMYLVAGFAAAYALMRLLGWSVRVFVAVLVLMVAAAEVLGAVGEGVPVVGQTGNLAFVGLLLVAVVVEYRLRSRRGVRTDLRWGVAALVTLLTAFAIWNLGQNGWCDPRSLWQAHAVWHVLCAVAAYLLFRLYTSEAASESRNQTVSS